MRPFFPARFGNPAALAGGPSFVGPLDDYTTALAGAWLPFRGFASYLGDSVEIRDTTGGSLQEVGFDAVTGDENAITTTGNAAMKTWYDQSGNSRNLLGATDDVQPLRIAAVLNGYPVARLDGVDDVMSAAWSGTAAARTLYVVARKRSAATGGTFNAACKINDNTWLDCNATGAWLFGQTEAFGTQSLGGTVTTWSLVAVKFTNADTAQGWINNSASSSWDPRIEYQNAGFTVGGSINAFADADVSAVLLYDAAHNDATRQAIQTILATKFNITLA